MIELTLRRVITVYTPLALSWLLMAAESPVAVSILSRGAEPKLHTAGLLALMAICLMLESPVIDLLTTSTALGSDAQRLSVLSRFTLLMMGLCTAAHLLLVATPAYGWLMDVMQLPQALRDILLPALVIMLPWSAAIGWRRYRQGIMIRNGLTRAISLGTGLRLLTIASVGFGLALLTKMPGIQVAATAIVSSVVVEALFVHFASKSAVEIQTSAPADERPLDLRAVLKFHTPLTGATFVQLASISLISAALARTHDSILQMAAWQVCSSIAWSFRTMTFALPEVIISLGTTRQAATLLRRFCLNLGLVLSALQLGFAISGLDRWVFERVLHTSPDTALVAHYALLAMALIPVISAATSYVRGRLTSAHVTLARLWSIGASTVVLQASLMLLVTMGYPGWVVGSVSVYTSILTDFLVQAVFWLRSEHREISEPLALQ